MEFFVAHSVIGEKKKKVSAGDLNEAIFFPL